mmetsp:Transcript_26058/g.66394  ORF Transcript_26058/g.66394 Transcript_26058/m.66394 type:complete len:240 (+) Transcript_26058:216-935(+)
MRSPRFARPRSSRIFWSSKPKAASANPRALWQSGRWKNSAFSSAVNLRVLLRSCVVSLSSSSPGSGPSAFRIGGPGGSPSPCHCKTALIVLQSNASFTKLPSYGCGCPMPFCRAPLAASMSGVWPLRSGRAACARSRSSARTTAGRPARTATCSGASPSPLRRSTFPFIEARARTMSAARSSSLMLTAATCIELRPAESVKLTSARSPPRPSPTSTRSLTLGRSPAATSLCRTTPLSGL